MGKVKREHVFGGLALLFTILLSIVIIRYWEFVRDVSGYGYVGAFLISILSGGTLLVPVPGVVVIFTLGGVLQPALVGVAAGLGEAVGGIFVYLTGYGGRSALERKLPNFYPWMTAWIKRRGSLAVFLYSAIFNPFFYPLTVATGALRFGLWKFFILSWAGKTIKGMMVAYAGHLGLNWILGLFG